MAAIASNGTGGGFWDAAATWVGGTPPAGANTMNIVSTDTVTVRTAGGAAGCAGGTITGTLNVTSTAGFTLTGAVTHNGTFGMAGSGSNAVPTLMTLNGCVWTCGVAAIWAVVGTLPYTALDILITGNATAQFDGVYRTGITGVIEKAEFRTFGMSRLFYRFSSSSPAMRWTDIYFNSIAAGACFAGGSLSLISQVYLTGTIYFRGTVAGVLSFSYCALYGTATILIEASAATNGALLGNSFLYGTTHVNINEKGGANKVGIVYFYDDTILDFLDVDTNAVNNVQFNDRVLVRLLTTTANRKMFIRSYALDTDSAITLTNSAEGMTVCSLNAVFVLNNLAVTVAGGTVILNDSFTNAIHWQTSRSINFAIIGAAAITLNGTGSVLQYEPILYKYDLTNYLFAIQYDMTVGTPNYTALYGTSVGWTAATKTLAAGGQLIINSTGHTATGMDMAISSFTGFTLTTSGTATINTAAYNISFDGGSTWSGDYTAAQLQGNSYTINGLTYTTDPNKNIQLRIKLTSTLGGTVTQVIANGIKYSPVSAGWTVRGALEDMQGTGFVTPNDSLEYIASNVAGIKSNVSGLSVHGGRVMSRSSGAVFVNDRFIKVHNFTS